MVGGYAGLHWLKFVHLRGGLARVVLGVVMTWKERGTIFFHVLFWLACLVSVGMMSFALATFGHPTAVWFWRDILGVM